MLLDRIVKCLAPRGAREEALAASEARGFSFA